MNMMEQQLKNRITLALESIDGVDSIDIDNINDKNVKTKTLGSFEYDGLSYWFYYSENKHLVILEITFAFTFEKIEESNNTNILEAINDFNTGSTAIKASLSEERLNNGEIDIEFTYGLLNELPYIKKHGYDLEPGISILSYVPTTMSAILLEKNIAHDVIEYNYEDDN